MFKYYTSSTYRKTYQILQILQLFSPSLDIKPYKLGNHILSKNSTSKTNNKKQKVEQGQTKNDNMFDRLLEEITILKDAKYTPVQCFKSILYIHTYFLLVRQLPNEKQTAEIYQFFKFIMLQANKLIQKYTEKQQTTNTYRSKSKQISNSKSKQKSSSSFLKTSVPFSIFSSNSKGLSSSQTIQNKSKQLVNKAKVRADSVNSKSNHDSSSSVKKQINLSKTRSQSLPQNQGQSQQRDACWTNRSNRNQQIISKQIFLLMNIVKPYVLYLQKILSIYQLYQQLIYQKKQINMDECWCIINFFKLIGSICINFSFIGRYFYKDFSKIVYLLIEYFSKQIGRVYSKVYTFCIKNIKQIEHSFYQLCNSHSEFQVYQNDQIQIPLVNQLVKIIEEISKVNQRFFHIYLGKYFYRNLQNMRIEEPIWLDATSKQSDFLFHFYQIKNKIKTKARIRTKQQIAAQIEHNLGHNTYKQKNRNSHIDNKSLNSGEDLKQNINLYKAHQIQDKVNCCRFKPSEAQIKKSLKIGAISKRQQYKLKLVNQRKNQRQISMKPNNQKSSIDQKLVKRQSKKFNQQQSFESNFQTPTFRIQSNY